MNFKITNRIYKPAYKNHPMTVWVRENDANMSWALLHGLHIGAEYKYRYGKDHKSTAILKNIADFMFHDDFDWRCYGCMDFFFLTEHIV